MGLRCWLPLFLLLPLWRSLAAEVEVADTAALERAVRLARAGQTITLAPGTYSIAGLRSEADGSDAMPVIVRARRLGEAQMQVTGVVGFAVRHPFWRFENLDLTGSAGSEHAFHVVGRASSTVIHGNRMVDFAAAIKGNGVGDGGERVYPDDVLIEDNLIYNRAILQTTAWLTPIDVVGGRRWVVRGNFIADFSKTVQDHPFYGGFIKGNARSGVFERNLVVCAWRHRGGARIGLSFGDSGTGAQYCDGGCSAESVGGVIRNNVVMNCGVGAGLHLNRAPGTQILHNTVVGSAGIQIEAAETSADIRNNLIAGGVRVAGGALAAIGHNALVDVAAGADHAAGLGQRLPDVSEDFCGQPRPALPQLGATEPGCSVTARLHEIEARIARLP
jgi:hypothetical protein